MEPPGDRRHLPAWIGWEDGEPHDADRGQDQRATDSRLAWNAPVAGEQDECHREDRSETKMKEPSGRTQRVFRGGIDPGVKRLIEEVAAKDCCRTKKNESLSATATYE